MDTEHDGTKEFSNNKIVGESALAPMDSDDRVTSTSSSKPKEQKPAKRTKLGSKKTSGQEKLVCRYCGSEDLAPSFKKRREKADLILLDWEMPIMNGSTFLKRRTTRSDLRSIPVLVLSAASNIGENVARLKAQFMQKPLDFVRLLATMKSLLAEQTE